MIASQLPAAPAASGGAGPAPAGDTGAGQAAADGGFAGLFAPAATPADGRATVDAGTGTDSAALDEPAGDGSTADPDLAERLLALIGMSAAPATASPPSPGDAPPPSLAALPGRGARSRGGVAALPGATSTGAATLPGLAAGDAVSGTDVPGPAAVSSAVASATVSPAASSAPALTAVASTAPVASASGPAPATGPLALAPAIAATTAGDAGGVAGPVADLANLPGGLRGIDPARPGAVEVGATMDAGLEGIGERGALQGNIQAASAPRGAASAVPAATALTMPVDADAGFDDSFGARIGWLADQHIGRAELRVSPDRFGTIDIRLQMDGNRVSADFQASHVEVRHALENSVGRLREMLGQQGLQLAHAGVGHGGDGARHDAPGTAGHAGGHDDQLGDDRIVDLRPAAAVRNRGLLDEYA